MQWESWNNTLITKYLSLVLHLYVNTAVITGRKKCVYILLTVLIGSFLVITECLCVILGNIDNVLRNLTTMHKKKLMDYNI